METRLVVVERGCPGCPDAKRAVNFINMHLSDLKQIRIVDNYEWEEFHFINHPVLEQLGENFDSYPYILIDNIEVEIAPKELLIISIGKIVEDDLLSPIRIGNIEIG